MYSGTKIAKASHLHPYTREDSPLIEGKGTRPIMQISLIQRKEKRYPREKKAPSRSGLPLSRHVVLKTTYVNPIIHVRRH